MVSSFAYSYQRLLRQVTPKALLPTVLDIDEWRTRFFKVKHILAGIRFVIQIGAVSIVLSFVFYLGCCSALEK